MDIICCKCKKEYDFNDNLYQLERLSLVLVCPHCNLTHIIKFNISEPVSTKILKKISKLKLSPVTLDLFEYPTDALAQENYPSSDAAVEATGGTIAYAGGYTIHTFTSNGTFTVTKGGKVEYLIIAGGGGGGQTNAGNAGAGGAGGYRCSVPGESSGGGASAENKLDVTVQAYSVVVGAGGGSQANGANSSFGGIVAIGGGYGGWYVNNDPNSGGSGGGNGQRTDYQTAPGAAGTSGQGYAGGLSGWRGGGGGGGAGAVGSPAYGGGDYREGGYGGAGVTSSITGSAVTRAGGGAGSSHNSATQGTPQGGAGGGGNGHYGAAAATNGAANTGSGGGGGGEDKASGSGGSGIVIIRYKTVSPLQCYSEATIKQQGSYSLKGIAVATDSLNDTLTRTVSPTIDLSNQTQIKYWVRALRTGSNFKIGWRDSGGYVIEHTPNILVSDEWQEETVDISVVSNVDKDAINQIQFTVIDADAPNIVYLDNMYGGVIVFTLVIANASHAHTVQALDLIQNYTLSIADVNHTHTAEGLALTQKHTLIIADCQHIHTAEQLTLIQHFTLEEIQSAVHPHTVQNITLIQNFTLEIQTSIHSHIVETLNLFQRHLLAIGDIVHSHTVEGITLTQKHIIIIQSVIHYHSAESLVLFQKHFLIISNILNHHIAENIELIIPPLASITIDEPVTLEEGKVYKIRVRHNIDDSFEEKKITNEPGTYTKLTIIGTWNIIPQDYDVYVIGIENIVVKPFRIVNMKRRAGGEGELMALEYNEAIFEDSTFKLPISNYSLLSIDVPYVMNLKLTEGIVKLADGTIEDFIDVWFSIPDTLSHYVKRYLKAKIYLSDNNGESWEYRGETFSDSFRILGGLSSGTAYKIAVTSVSDSGEETTIPNSPQATITVVGKQAPPANVTGFDVYQQGNMLYFTCDIPPDIDFAYFRIKQGTDWNYGKKIIERADLNKFPYPVGEIRTLTFMIKAVDTSENESAGVTYDTLIVVPPPEMSFINAFDLWSVPLEYKRNNMDLIWGNQHDKNFNRVMLALKTAKTWEDLEAEGQTWEWQEENDGLILDKEFESSGYFQMIKPIDLKTKFPFKVILDASYWAGLNCTLTIQVSISDDDITYTEFETIDANKLYTARYIKFKVIIANTDIVYNLYLYDMTIWVNAPSVKKAWGQDIAVPIEGKIIIFGVDFTLPPRFMAIVSNGVAGYVSWAKEDLTKDQNKVYVKDFAGSAVGTGEINYLAEGM